MIALPFPAEPCYCCERLVQSAETFVRGKPVCDQCAKPLEAAADAKRQVMERRLSEVAQPWKPKTPTL